MKQGKEMLSTVINRLIENEMFGWPPVCSGIFYQPTRPVVPESKKEKLVIVQAKSEKKK